MNCLAVKEVAIDDGKVEEIAYQDALSCSTSLTQRSTVLETNTITVYHGYHSRRGAVYLIVNPLGSSFMLPSE